MSKIGRRGTFGRHGSRPSRIKSFDTKIKFKENIKCLRECLREKQLREEMSNSVNDLRALSSLIGEVYNEFQRNLTCRTKMVMIDST